MQFLLLITSYYFSFVTHYQKETIVLVDPLAILTNELTPLKVWSKRMLSPLGVSTNSFSFSKYLLNIAEL